MSFASFPTWNPNVGFWGNVLAQALVFGAFAAIIGFQTRLKRSGEQGSGTKPEAGPSASRNDSNPADGPKGIGGWLAFFCIGLIILAPIYSLIVMSQDWEASKPTFEQFPSLKAAVIFENVSCWLILLYGMVVGCIVWNESPAGRDIAKQYLLIRLFSFIPIAVITTKIAGSLPTDLAQSSFAGEVRAFIREVVFFLVWWLYFNKSKRVRNTYGDKSKQHIPEDAPPIVPQEKDHRDSSVPIADERITALPDCVPASAGVGAEWNLIHDGTELGPLSHAQLVEKVEAGEIDPGDLVKQKEGGLWAQARTFSFLEEQFRLRNAREKAKKDAIDELARFNGLWLSKKALAVGGCVLLALVGVVVVSGFKAARATDARQKAERQLEEERLEAQRRLEDERLEVERRFEEERRQENQRSISPGPHYRSESWLNPRDPLIGENYVLGVRVTNISVRKIAFTVTVTSVPIGDLLLNSPSWRVVAAPGQSGTVRFNINCGVEGGRVLYGVRACWAD